MAIAGPPFDRATTPQFGMFGKRPASNSEIAPLFDKSTATGNPYAWIIAYRGATTTENPWQVVETASTGTSDPSPISGITTTTDNALVVVAVGGEDDNNGAITATGTDPAAYTEHYAEQKIGGNGGATPF